MNNQEKRKVFEAHLSGHKKLREEQLQRKHMEDQKTKNPLEHELYIMKQMQTLSKDFEEQIQLYKDKQIDFQILQKALIRLKDYYVSMSYALKNYDRQSYKEMLDKYQASIITLKQKYEPRQKFKFSRRDGDFGVKSTAVVQEEVKAKQTKDLNIPGMSGLTDGQVTVKEGWSSVGSYKITDCSGTSVQLLEKTEILFLKNLKNCRIMAATTKSTVFVDNCQNCTFQLSCHQLRIHNTTDSEFGIFVTSKAIIEDCDKVVFKPYSFKYEGREEDQKVFERFGKENLWREIQDFNWLKDNVKSPHFELVDQ